MEAKQLLFMSTLNSNEKESPESQYMNIFYPAMLAAATKAGILGNEVGDNWFSFEHEGKKVTIKIIVK